VVPKPSENSIASVDSCIIIEVAHEMGTVAVIKSPHFDLLTPRVSLTGLYLTLHHLTVIKNVMKKKTIKKIKKNQSQYW
jgi:predicted transporter